MNNIHAHDNNEINTINKSCKYIYFLSITFYLFIKLLLYLISRAISNIVSRGYDT